MKKALALLMALAVIIMSLAACSTSTPSSDSGSGLNSDSGSSSNSGSSTPVGFDNVSYVMVYNPDIYSENERYNEKRTTGNFSAYIDTDISRAEELGKDFGIGTISQGNYMAQYKDVEVDFSSDRAGYVPPVYKVGDKADFYGSKVDAAQNPEKESFTCVYEGEYCYAWLPSDTTPDLDEVKDFVKEFDEVIYPTDVKLFGEPRFSEDNNKISILIQSTYGNDSLGGYFMPLELCTPTELLASDAETYGVNTGHAMLHINESFLGDPNYRTELLRTIAHELQHLINFSDVFYTVNSENINKIMLKSQPTWINEAMSGFAEEQIYPNEASMFYRYAQFASSDRIITGQSLYNFENSLSPTADDKYADDFGVYGSVLFFTEYLSTNDDKEVFSKMHGYWRTCYEPILMDSDALYDAVSTQYRDEIDSKYSYPSDWEFDSEDQEWMSKLTLDFYIWMTENDVPEVPDTEDFSAYTDSDKEAIRSKLRTFILYDEVNPAEIEGGGRIVFATKDGKFEIPSDASDHLVYVGFDSNFKQVTDVVYR